MRASLQVLLVLSAILMSLTEICAADLKPGIELKYEKFKGPRFENSDRKSWNERPDFRSPREYSFGLSDRFAERNGRNLERFKTFEKDFISRNSFFKADIGPSFFDKSFNPISPSALNILKPGAFVYVQNDQGGLTLCQVADSIAGNPNAVSCWDPQQPLAGQMTMDVSGLNPNKDFRPDLSQMEIRTLSLEDSKMILGRQAQTPELEKEHRKDLTTCFTQGVSSSFTGFKELAQISLEVTKTASEAIQGDLIAREKVGHALKAYQEFGANVDAMIHDDEFDYIFGRYDRIEERQERIRKVTAAAAGVIKDAYAADSHTKAEWATQFAGSVLGDAVFGLGIGRISRVLKGAEKIAHASEGLAKAPIVGDELGEVVQAAEKRIANIDPRTNKWVQSHLADVEVIDAEVLDASDMSTRQPSWLAGTQVVEGKTKDWQEFVRVHLPDNREGYWIVKRESIAGLSRAQMKYKLALKYEPSLMSTIRIPPGNRIRRGLVNNSFGGGKGAIQYEIPGPYTDDFVKMYQSWFIGPTQEIP